MVPSNPTVGHHEVLQPLGLVEHGGEHPEASHNQGMLDLDYSREMLVEARRLDTSLARKPVDPERLQPLALEQGFRDVE